MVLICAVIFGASGCPPEEPSMTGMGKGMVSELLTSADLPPPSPPPGQPPPDLFAAVRIVEGHSLNVDFQRFCMRCARSSMFWLEG